MSSKNQNQTKLETDYMFIMLIICSFVCRQRVLVGQWLQRSSACGRERPQHCWATRITGVPNVSSPAKKTSLPIKFMLAVGAYSGCP